MRHFIEATIFLIIIVLAGFAAVNQSGVLNRAPSASSTPTAVQKTSSLQSPSGVQTSRKTTSVPSATPAVLTPAKQPYTPKVRAEIWHYSTDVGNEYVILQNVDDVTHAPVDITGWRVENERGVGYTIPQASPIPYIGDVAEDIVLPYQGKAYIHTGTHNGRISFRENMCTGYLNQNETFTPLLAQSCPDLPSTQELLDKNLNSACIDFVHNQSNCRAPASIPYNTELAIGSSCIDYVNAHLNYAGCVQTHRTETGFFKDQWQVFINRTERVFDTSHAGVVIKDGTGRPLYQYAY